MSESWVILETSGRGGAVGLAVGDQLTTAALDPARRHNRDLAPTVAGLLAARGLAPKDLTGVMVSIGPGSYTGLRVGIMSAKALAWATGCRLVAVPTFQAIAERVPEPVEMVDVVADALQGLAYVQRFRRSEPVDELRIEPAATWAGRLAGDVWTTGPGLAGFDGLVSSSVSRVAPELRLPTVESVFRVGRRMSAVSESEFLALEPLYLRGSSAEEKAKATSK